ncbi:MAG TPA: hypothetical protein VKB50_30615 [Vicinamibacterales bacterium]|nr:hypothetical protein [Vicinamibacterales bacterium]
MSAALTPSLTSDLSVADGATPTPRCDSIVQIGNHTVTVSVCVLRAEERELVAASVAWLAAASTVPAPALKNDAWHALIERVLSPYVAFTVDHDEPERLGGAWWDQAMREATKSFIHANTLEDLIRQFLVSIDAQSRRTTAVS